MATSFPTPPTVFYPHAPVEFLPTPNQPGLRRSDRDVRHQRYLRQFVAEHVMQEKRLCMLGFHRHQVLAHALEFGASDSLSLDVSWGSGGFGFSLDLPVEHRPLSTPRTKRVEADVAGHRGCPGFQTAGPRKRLPRQREHDLLESSLHQVFVIGFAASEHTIKGM